MWFARFVNRIHVRVEPAKDDHRLVLADVLQRVRKESPFARIDAMRDTIVGRHTASGDLLEPQ